MSTILKIPGTLGVPSEHGSCLAVDMSEITAIRWTWLSEDDPDSWWLKIWFYFSASTEPDVRSYSAKISEELACHIAGSADARGIAEINARSGCDSDGSLSFAVRDWCRSMLEKLLELWQETRAGGDYPTTGIYELLPVPSEPELLDSRAHGVAQPVVRDLAKALACAVTPPIEDLSGHPGAEWIRETPFFYLSMDHGDAVVWSERPWFDDISETWKPSSLGSECAALPELAVVPSWFCGGLASVEVQTMHGCTVYAYRWLHLKDYVLPPSAAFVIRRDGAPCVQVGGWDSEDFEGSGLPGVLAGNWPEIFRAHVADMVGESPEGDDL